MVALIILILEILYRLVTILQDIRQLKSFL